MFERLWIVFAKEAIDNFRDRRSLAMALAYPFIGPVLVGAPMASQMPPTSLPATPDYAAGAEISSVVIAAIVAHPEAVSAIVAAAIQAAPEHRANIAAQASAAFPGFAATIAWIANQPAA